MKKSNYSIQILITTFCCLITLSLSAQSVHPKMAEIHKLYYQKFPKTISFVQKTEMYRADTVYRRETWYEAGRFPTHFRIDFGHPKEGNSVIYHGDSTFNFRKGQKSKPSINPNILIYLLGGMYFETIEEVGKKLALNGFDLTKTYNTTWNGKPVVVIGVMEADLSKSQLWFDAKNSYLVRLIQHREKSVLECQFEGQKKTGNMWHETFVKIYNNNKLIQTETYSKFRTDVTLSPDFFDPNSYGSWHWLNY